MKSKRNSIAGCLPEMKHVAQTKGEMITMKSESAQKESNLILPPPPANGRGELLPFLKAKHISKNETTQITLLGEGRESRSRFGVGIEVTCKIGSEKYAWTIKYDSPNYRRLYKRFGSDITKWKGIVKVERKEHMGKEYVAVVD